MVPVTIFCWYEKKSAKAAHVMLLSQRPTRPAPARGITPHHPRISARRFPPQVQAAQLADLNGKLRLVEQLRNENAEREGEIAEALRQQQRER